MDGEHGITADDLPSIYREAYLNAVETARHEHDPRDDWDGFVEYLWQALAPALGLEVPQGRVMSGPDRQTRAGSA